MTVLAELLDGDDARILITTDWSLKELAKTIPGCNHSRTHDGWLLPTSWAGCLALRSTFRDQLEIGPRLADWAVNEKADRVDPCNELRTLIDYDGDPDLYGWQRSGAEFIRRGKRVLIGDAMGCVEGDAEILVERAGGTRRTSLRELHRKFNGNELPTFRWNSAVPTRTKSMFGDGTLALNEIVAVVAKGDQPVLRFTLASGRTLRVTVDHVMSTQPGAWRPAGELGVGDTLSVNGEATSGKRGQVWFRAHTDEIVSVVDDGVTDVYDIEMAAPAHSFVANGIIVHNSGKTGTAIRGLARAFAAGENVFPILVVCPNSVKRSWQREFARWWPGIVVQVLQGSTMQRRKQLKEAAHVYVVNWEGLRNLSRLEGYGSISLARCTAHGGEDPRVTENKCEVHPRELNAFTWNTVIADECFVAGTAIDTPTGPRAIESLRVGDAVCGYDHSTGRVLTSQVSATMTREASSIVPEFGSTPNHPVYVDGSGYRAVGDLAVGDTVLVRENVPGLPDRVRRYSAEDVFNHVWPTRRAGDVLPGYSFSQREARLAASSVWNEHQPAALSAAVRVPGHIVSNGGVGCRCNPHGDAHEPGVDGHPLLELRDSERYERVCAAGALGAGETQTVYSLTTTSGNYFASSVLVRNCHRSRSPQSKQTRALWQLGKDVPFKIAMSGTPTGGDISDLWSILHWLAPEEWPSKSRWMDRTLNVMLNAWGGAIVNGVKAEMEQEFYASFNPRFRRMPEELVLAHLPPIVYEQVDVEMSAKQAKAYRDMRDQMLADIDGGLLTVGSPLIRTIRLLQLASSFGNVEMIAQPDGTEKPKVTLIEPSSKIDAFLDDLDDFGNESVVVAAVSRQLIELLSARLTKLKIRHGLVTGAQDEDERTQAIDEFQAGATKLILITAAAGGTGTTLTAGRYLVRLQRPVSLIDDSQLLRRVRRIGSERHETIIVRDYVTVGTLDEAVITLLENKSASFESLVRDKDMLRKMLRGEEL